MNGFIIYTMRYTSLSDDHIFVLSPRPKEPQPLPGLNNASKDCLIFRLSRFWESQVKNNADFVPFLL